MNSYKGVFVFLLLWLFPTKSYVDNKLQDGLDPLYQQLFNEHLQTMKDAAQSYYTKDRLPKKVGDKVSITLGEMLDKKLVTTFVDSNNKQCSLTGSYVEITKMDSEYMMKVNLNCSDKSDYIIVYMGCYNYCDDYLCEKKETTSTQTNNNTSNKKPTNNNTTVTPTVTKKYQYEYVLKTEATYSDWSNWSGWSANKVTENTYRDVETKKELKVVGTEKVKVDTDISYVSAIRQNKTTTYNAKSSLICPTGYFRYWMGDTQVCAARTSTSSNVVSGIVTNQVDALVNESKICSVGILNANGLCESTTTIAASSSKDYTDWVYQGRQTFNGTMVTNTTTKYVWVSSKDELDCTNGCTAVTKNTYDVYKRTANTSYSCAAGYTLSGSVCTKKTTSQPTIVPSYYCADGSNPVNGKCTVTTSSNVATSTPKCTYGSYDSTTGYCIYNGETTYTCPEYAADGKVSGNKCVVERSSYVCDEGSLVGTKCKITKNIYETQDKYDYVTYYRYRTRKYIDATETKVWSTSNNDKELLNKGYTLTGNKKLIG